MWRLHQSNEQNLPNRSDRRNLAQQFRRAVFPTLGQQLSSYLLAQRPQRVQLLVVDLRPPSHADFADLGQPFTTIARCVQALARAGNSPASIESFQTIHHSRDIPVQCHVAAGQFFQSPYAVLCMVDRGEKPGPEKIGQLSSIDPVILVPPLSMAFLRRSHTRT